MRTAFASLVVSATAFIACTTSNSTADSDAPLDALADVPAIDTTTASDAASADTPAVSYDGNADAATGGTYTVHMPTVTVASGEETTQCVELLLGNTNAELVRHIHVSLAPGSHHLIFYRSTATAPAPTPTPCQPLGGIQTGSAPLFIAQATESDLVVPDNAGISIAANQMIRIEEHFLNITTAPIAGTATITVDSVPESSGLTPADLFFWGTRSISIPPHTAGTADFYNAVQTGVHVFGLTAHEHHFGTLTTITQAASATATGTELYRNTNWAEPPLRQYVPPIAFDGSDGLHLHCEYMNTSDATVRFGESAETDEMCFFWAYYYPSHGFDIRIR
jgi:hypothetical protein